MLIILPLPHFGRIARSRAVTGAVRVARSQRSSDEGTHAFSTNTGSFSRCRGSVGRQQPATTLVAMIDGCHCAGRGRQTPPPRVCAADMASRAARLMSFRRWSHWSVRMNEFRLTIGRCSICSERQVLASRTLANGCFRRQSPSL